MQKGWRGWSWISYW